MNYLLIILLFVSFASNAQLSCVESSKDKEYDIVLRFNNDIIANEDCIKLLLSDPKIKEQTRIKVYCTKSINEIPKSFFRLSHIKSLRIEGIEEPKWDNCKGEDVLADFNAFIELEVLEFIYLPIACINDKLTFPKLKSFTAHYTCLQSFPKALLKSKQLEHLTLSYSAITQIPNNICKAKNLSTLVLTSNPIKELSKGLFNLQNLMILNIDGTNVTVIPDEIVKLKKLQFFSALTITGIGKCSSLICGLPNLKHFACAFEKENVQPVCFKDTGVWKIDGLDYKKIE